MNSIVSIELTATKEQYARLLALQSTFAKACNTLAPIVQSTKIWNRVALHHMGYRLLRDQFPALGSQLACNAVYSVSLASRIVFQTAGSPFHISRIQGKPLPLLKFTDDAPVYLDRHTVSIKNHELSLFTLDGRMRFQLHLHPHQMERFLTTKLREIILRRNKNKIFELSFAFEKAATATHTVPDSESPVLNINHVSRYLNIQEAA